MVRQSLLPNSLMPFWAILSITIKELVCVCACTTITREELLHEQALYLNDVINNCCEVILL